MPKKHPHLTEEEKLQQENNYMKLKLIAENGAEFFDDEGKRMDPQLENQWLSYISNYEEIHKNAKKVSLFEFIGKPDFIPASEITEAEAPEALVSLLQTMNENDVSLTTICEYDDLLIYKFITEELFQYEMEDVRMKGMTTNFIYEEFHPNHEHDLRGSTSDFISALLHNKWSEYDDILLGKQIAVFSEKKIKKEEFKMHITLFQDSWKATEVEKEEITDVWFDIEKQKARTDLLLEYKTISENNEATSFCGKATLYFEMEDDYWTITKVVIPGFYSAP